MLHIKACRTLLNVGKGTTVQTQKTNNGWYLSIQFKHMSQICFP